MKNKWDSQKKWQQLMTDIQWKGITNWNDVDTQFLLKEIPGVQEWALKTITLLPDHDVRLAFKQFFISNDDMSQHDYTRKNQAVTALMLAYAVEQKYVGN